MSIFFYFGTCSGFLKHRNAISKIRSIRAVITMEILLLKIIFIFDFTFKFIICCIIFLKNSILINRFAVINNCTLWNLSLQKQKPSPHYIRLVCICMLIHIYCCYRWESSNKNGILHYLDLILCNCILLCLLTFIFNI